MDIQPLFQTSTKYTFEEYKRYNQCFQKSRLKRLMIPLVLIAAIGIVEIILHSYIYGVFFLLFAAVYPFLLLYIMNRRLKKVWESGKIFQNRVSQIEFYEDKIRSCSDQSSTFYQHDSLYKIIETDTNFYFFISAYQAFIVVKENCSAELIEYIRDLKAKITKKK